MALGGVPPVECSCTCKEYRVNEHLARAVSAGKRVARNPGKVCKHILAAWGLAGHWDLLAVCEDLPDGLKDEARHAYKQERKRLLQA